MNADGTRQKVVSTQNKNQASGSPDYAPSGNRLAWYRVTFNKSGDGFAASDIFVRNKKHNTNITRKDSAQYFSPTWSPDGQKLVAILGDESIVSMNPDGTGVDVLTTISGAETSIGSVVYSPDGTKIAFLQCDGDCGDPELQGQGSIWVMNADGTGKQLIFDGTSAVQPARSPCPAQRSSPSNSVTHTTPPDTTPPSPAPVVSLQNAWPTRTMVSWTLARDELTQTWHDLYIDGVLHSEAFLSSWTIFYLDPQSTHTFQVKARDYFGNTVASNVLTATTPAKTDNVAPTAPTNLQFSFQTDPPELWLTWSPSTDDADSAGAHPLRDVSERRSRPRRRRRRTLLTRPEGQLARDDALAAAPVDDVDRVVLPVRAGDPEEEREPAPEPELALLGQRPLEDERVPSTS